MHQFNKYISRKSVLFVISLIALLSNTSFKPKKPARIIIYYLTCFTQTGEVTGTELMQTEYTGKTIIDKEQEIIESQVALNKIVKSNKIPYDFEFFHPRCVICFYYGNDCRMDFILDGVANYQYKSKQFKNTEDLQKLIKKYAPNFMCSE